MPACSYGCLMTIQGVRGRARTAPRVLGAVIGVSPKSLLKTFHELIIFWECIEHNAYPRHKCRHRRCVPVTSICSKASSFMLIRVKCAIQIWVTAQLSLNFFQFWNISASSTFNLRLENHIFSLGPIAPEMVRIEIDVMYFLLRLCRLLLVSAAASSCLNSQLQSESNLLLLRLQLCALLPNYETYNFY